MGMISRACHCVAGWCVVQCGRAQAAPIARIRNAIANPPRSEKEVGALIQAFAPDSVTLSFGVSVSELFVQVENLEAGGSITISLSRFIAEVTDS